MDGDFSQRADDSSDRSAWLDWVSPEHQDWLREEPLALNNDVRNWLVEDQPARQRLQIPEGVDAEVWNIAVTCPTFQALSSEATLAMAGSREPRGFPLNAVLLRSGAASPWLDWIASGWGPFIGRQSAPRHEIDREGVVSTCARNIKRLWKNTTKEVCDGFGKALASGQTPNIEAYLSRIADADRIAAFYGLLTREVDFFEATGKPIDVDAYRSRFTDKSEIVESVLFRDEQIKELLRECGYIMIAKFATQRTGDVYKVQNVETRACEALTRIPAFMLRPSAREGQGLDFAYMNHSGIARPTNVIQAHADMLIATEFVDGLDFSSLVENGTTPIDSAVELVRQSAEAVAWIHAHGHVHGTLSPTSLLLSTDSRGMPLVNLCGPAFFQLADVNLSRFRPEPPGIQLEDVCAARERG